MEQGQSLRRLVIIAKGRLLPVCPRNLVPRGCASSAVTGSSGSPHICATRASGMQDFLVQDPAIVNSMKASLSGPRFARYLSVTGGDDRKALALYQWNALISQSLYVYIQCWEICLRNKVDGFLRWKYSEKWPYDQNRAVRNLQGNDRKRLLETISRQHSQRGFSLVSTDSIVADLSAGFWVSQLSKSYAVPYVWNYNLVKIFPNDTALNTRAAWEICDRTLNLRNRIAHHEPIYHLDLQQHYGDLQRIVAAMCKGTSAFANANSSFRHVFESKP